KLPTEMIADLQREQAGNLIMLGPRYLKEAREILEDAVKRLDAAKDNPHPMMKGIILGDLGQTKIALADRSKDEKEQKILYAEAEKDLSLAYDIITKAIKAETNRGKVPIEVRQLMLVVNRLIAVIKKRGKDDNDAEIKKLA